MDDTIIGDFINDGRSTNEIPQSFIRVVSVLFQDSSHISCDSGSLAWARFVSLRPTNHRRETFLPSILKTNTHSSNGKHSVTCGSDRQNSRKDSTFMFIDSLMEEEKTSFYMFYLKSSFSPTKVMMSIVCRKGISNIPDIGIRSLDYIFYLTERNLLQ